jgi:hypothetical protein
MKKKQQNNQIIIYQGDDGQLKVEVNFGNETAWLTQTKIAELFGTTKQNISLHLKNIFADNELDSNSVVKEFLTTAEDGKKYLTNFYNLDAIISVGYRVNSTRATQFRIWATERLKEYIIKGFTMDDERLKSNGGGNYWKELLDRIRDIRSSEKALYRQVLDLYATSVDYNPNSGESIMFFKTVQNKLHYATNLQTAAETIKTRANAEKDFMGLTTFAGALPTLNEVTIAKNYLTEDELFRLNRMVSAFFDLAEIKAQEHIQMKMSDWIKELDKFTQNYGKGVLTDAGRVTHEQAIKKARNEYRKYQAKTLSPVEEDYLENIKAVEKKIKKKIKK